MSPVLDVTIRLAGADDAERIAEIYVSSSTGAERGLVPDDVLDARAPSDYVPSWHRRLAIPREKGGTLLARVDGAVVGFCFVEPDPDVGHPTGHVDLLYVDQAFAGRGIGSRLLQEGIDLLAALGCTGATLWTLAGNDRTQTFYRGRGWLADGIEKDDESDGLIYRLRHFRRAIDPVQELRSTNPVPGADAGEPRRP
ncbi:MAG: GNAT family N-acetyltransferase [Thermomicrobiales bacterium]